MTHTNSGCARVATFAIEGVDARPVWVEVDVRPGLPSFTIVGMAGAAVGETRVRVRAAILNSGFAFPTGRITANLAPASVRKSGASYDAALATAILAASRQCDPERLDDWAIVGELAVSGQLRPPRGVLAAAEGARRAGISGLIVPTQRAQEAALVDGLRVAAFDSLRPITELLAGSDIPPAPPVPDQDALTVPDLSDIRGHRVALRAMEIAAAGGHHLLLEGPPGSGKKLLARRLPGLLPPLTRAEATEVTRIQSVAGQLRELRLVRSRPFRAPHHTISATGLVGGGAVPLPGEASLAHHGVLLLDELAEFSRTSLEALRPPIRDGYVVVARRERALLFPTRCLLVATTDPCPCGYARSERTCVCSERERSVHRRRLNGPLMDHIDLRVAIARPTAEELGAPAPESSERVRERIVAARERQRHRLAGTSAICNGQLDPEQLRERVRISNPGRIWLGRTFKDDPGQRDRAVRVAATIADLDDRERIELDDLLQAAAMGTWRAGVDAAT